ncbi:MAG: DUF2208 family protein [Candidatus Bathyarchaeia archaeon]
MAFTKTKRYVRMMAPSLLFMAVITYGMATGNPWLQGLPVIIFYIVASLVYQVFRNIRMMPVVKANMIEADRAMSERVLFKATKEDVLAVRMRSKDTGEAKMGLSMIMMLFVPLAIFYLTGYAMGALIPGIESWKTYLIAFLLTIPFSLLITSRMGIGQAGGVMRLTPRSYTVTEQGIVIPQMGAIYITRFPIKQMITNEESGFIDVECQPTKIPVLSNKLRLYTNDVQRLSSILARFAEGERQ